MIKMTNKKVFLTPLIDAEFERDITLTYTVDSSVVIPKDCVVHLVLWNAGKPNLIFDKCWYHYLVVNHLLNDN